MENKKRKKTPKYVEVQQWSTTQLVDDELVDRCNIWHFYYFVAVTVVQLLEDFLDVAEFKVVDERYCFNKIPSEHVSAEDFEQMISAIKLLVRYHNEGGLIYGGKDINFEDGDFILELNDALHDFVNLLPYLNDRHFTLSEDRYEDAPNGRHSSLEELRNLDRTIARQLFPTLQVFAVKSIFTPRYFKRMYWRYPLPDSARTDQYNWSKEWDRALECMVESWQWILERKPIVNKEGFEDVPESVYYGLHLFAEYLPEMQND